MVVFGIEQRFKTKYALPIPRHSSMLSPCSGRVSPLSPSRPLGAVGQVKILSLILSTSPSLDKGKLTRRDTQCRLFYGGTLNYSLRSVI
jgi:hypothetical protein